MNSVAERVTLARTKRAMKKAELSERAGLSSGYLTQLENPRTGASIKQPSLEILQRLADVLAVPVVWLAFGTEPEPIWPEQAPVVVADDETSEGSEPPTAAE